MGKWSFENDLLILKERYGDINYFQVVDGELIFKEKDSSNFGFVKVSDGEKFLYMQNPEHLNMLN